LKGPGVVWHYEHMTKYKQYFHDMVEQNQALFDSFKIVHDGYKQDPKQWSQRFHSEGREVVEIVRDWERRLCAGMERGKNSVYSAKLAEKFWSEVKSYLSHIEKVGVRSNLDA
jgi:hypothetical protein